MQEYTQEAAAPADVEAYLRAVGRAAEGQVIHLPEPPTSPPVPQLRCGTGEREFWKALVLAFAANPTLIDGQPIALSAPLLADQVILRLRERSQ